MLVRNPESVSKVFGKIRSNADMHIEYILSNASDELNEMVHIKLLI